MQCLSCGQVCAESTRFCGNCGAPLTPPAQVPYPPATYGSPTTPRKPSRWAWVVGGAGVLVVLVTVLAVIMSKPDSAPSRANSSTPAAPAQKGPAQPAPAPKHSAAANAYFVGKWRCFSFGGGFCPVGWEDLQIRADGTYTLAAKSNGTWRMEGEKAVFAGPLAFAGPAEKYQTDQFQFNYVDKSSGFGTYIIFVPY